MITLPLGKGILGCLGEVESGSRLASNSISSSNYVATSGKILRGVLTLSLLHYFNCNVVYTHDLPKIASVFFIPHAYKLCLSGVLWRPCLLLHDPCTDAPGRTRKSVPYPCFYHLQIPPFSSHKSVLQLSGNPSQLAEVKHRDVKNLLCYF